MSLVDIALIRKYDVKGPRYTSYPTALQFDVFSPAQYQQAIKTSTRLDRTLSLYFHLPFCSTLCYYCACSKIVTRDKTKGARYLAYLKREIELQAPLFANRLVSQLHWGGGTPTFFDDDQVQDLMDHIRQNFQLVDDATDEFGIEVDPRTVDGQRTLRLRQAGFNRLSMGIQDFDPIVQKAVNRLQTYTATAEVIKAARADGFNSISVDLIYGLPHQTSKTIDTTLQQVIGLSPDRISIYNYAHMPTRFTPQQRIKGIDLPDPDQKLKILKQCIDTLVTAGYQYIGMDHFAKPDDELAVAQRNGTLQRNFQGYSTFADCDMVAMGVTAISHIGNHFSQNAKTLEAYEQALDQDQLPIEKGITIDNDDLIRKDIIMALICQFRLSFDSIEQAHNIVFKDYFAAELASLAGLQGDGLVTVDDQHIAVTEPGRLLIRNICMAFDRHLQSANAAQSALAAPTLSHYSSAI